MSFILGGHGDEYKRPPTLKTSHNICSTTRESLYCQNTLLPRQEKLEKTGTPQRHLTYCSEWDNPALTLAIKIMTQPQILAPGVEIVVFLHT